MKDNIELTTFGEKKKKKDTEDFDLSGMLNNLKKEIAETEKLIKNSKHAQEKVFHTQRLEGLKVLLEESTKLFKMGFK